MINNILQNLVDAQKEVFDYIADKSVDINERWDFFLKMPESLRKVSVSRPDFKSMNNELMNEFIYKEKGQLIFVENFLENIDCLVQYAKENTLEEYSSEAVKFKKKLLDIKMNNLQEEILSKGYHVFVNNW